MEISIKLARNLNFMRLILLPYYADCLILGDKADLDSEYQLELFETRGIQLHTPIRSNQKNYQKQLILFRKVRKRIETMFSQLVDQLPDGFDLKIVSLAGRTGRSVITAHTD